MRSLPSPVVGLLIACAALLAVAAVAQERGRDAESDQAPAIDNSITGVAREPLAGPLPVPPPGLEAAAGGPLARARDHLDRATVLDGLGVRVARKLLEADCDLVEPGARLLAHLSREGSAEVRTAGALLADPEASGSADRDRLESLDRRLRHLRRQAADSVRRAGPCPAADGPPSVYLTAAETTPIDGRVVLLAKASEPARVVWVDGSPAGVSEPDGWAVIVAAPGSRVLCEAPAAATTCDGGFAVEAVMGAAFDLRAH